jgi:hypothetical protein
LEMGHSVAALKEGVDCGSHMTTYTSGAYSTPQGVAELASRSVAACLQQHWKVCDACRPCQHRISQPSSLYQVCTASQQRVCCCTVRSATHAAPKQHCISQPSSLYQVCTASLPPMSALYLAAKQPVPGVYCVSAVCLLLHWEVCDACRPKQH